MIFFPFQTRGCKFDSSHSGFNIETGTVAGDGERTFHSGSTLHCYERTHQIPW